MSRGNAPRFLVDMTVARLGRWLRFLGFDTVMDRSEDHARLTLRAQREGRILLTRRRPETHKSRNTVVLSSDFLAEQLRQVVTQFGSGHGFLTRCTLCNSQLTLLSRTQADGRVPELIYKSQREFAYCARCDRYYWKGSHWKSVREASSVA